MKLLARHTGARLHGTRSRWAGGLRVAGWILAALSASACGGATAPGESYGQVLAGTGGVDCGRTEPFSFSPDRRWLAFTVRQNSAGKSPPQSQIALADLESGQTFLPHPDEQAAERIEAGQPPSLGRLCWAEDSRTLYLAGRTLPAGASAVGRMGSVAVREGWRPQPNWFAVDLPEATTLTATQPADCIETGPRQWRFGSPITEIETITRGLTVEKPSDRQVRLVLADGRLLAEHRPRRWLSTQAGILRFTWSPDGQHLAYVVQEGFGTWGVLSRTFTASSADHASPPRQLMAGPVYALGWRDNQELYACIRDSEENDTAIYRWRADNRKSVGANR